MLHEVFGKHQLVITLEDGTVTGGFGSAVAEFMVEAGYTSRIKRLGMPDRYVEHGSQQQLYAECGYDHAGIEIAAKTLLAEAQKSSFRTA
jgi:1-deoxy-D-xylulose-5-phosphate synthase